MMRIVHLAKYHSPLYGGMETHVETLARQQAELGQKVVILCINSFDNDLKPSQYTQTNITYIDQVQVIKVRRLFSFLKLDVCPSLIFYIRYFSKFPNTIFHVHTPNPTMLISLMLLGKINNLNLVITHHSDAIRQRLLKYLVRPIEYVIYRQAASILTTSKNYQAGSKFLRLYENQIDVLPLGIDISVFSNPAPNALDRVQQLKEKYGDVIWLAVGRLVYYKAFHIAIEALQFVPGKLLIIGTGKLAADLQKIACKFNVVDRVIWLGKASELDLIASYRAATALWLSSNVRSEAFGLVQVEAMASGCPVINCDVAGSGVPWVCRHEQEGLTVQPNQPRELAAAASRLLNEPGLRTRLSEGSKRRALEFTDTVMARRSLNIYDQVFGQENSTQSIPLKLRTRPIPEKAN
jgi:glycosyltransferase involved in cell wall biosynthesis